MTVPVEGFVFGLASSLHCAAMCGPLALFAGRRASATGAYHGARASTYVLAGAALGAAGDAAGVGLLQGSAPWIGLVLATGLLAGALGLDKLLGSIPGIAGLLRGAMGRARTWPLTARAALLGALTPLLPCGVLWALFGTALVAGDWRTGAATTGAFALGSAPLLLAAQFQAGLVHQRLGPRGARLLARGAMAVAAAILAWRALTGFEGGCCHD